MEIWMVIVAVGLFVVGAGCRFIAPTVKRWRDHRLTIRHAFAEDAEDVDRVVITRHDYLRDSGYWIDDFDSSSDG